MPGMILTADFTSPGKANGAGFKTYIDYIDRPEAISKMSKEQREAFEKIYDYQDYMANPEKSNGLFTESKDLLTEEEKQNVKQIFSSAQKKGSMLHRHVLSFENSWLSEIGALSEDGTLNESALRQHTRAAVASFLSREGMDDFVWTAAIHTNTAHTHIHIALIDPEPVWKEGKRRCRRAADGRLYQRGKVKQSSLEDAKRAFAQSAYGLSDKSYAITELLREGIVNDARKGQNMKRRLNHAVPNRMFEELLKALPRDKGNLNLWKYGANIMQPYRQQIDRLTEEMLKRYYPKEYEQFIGLVTEVSEKYERAFGQDDYAEKKIEDLYARFGNAILSECRKIEMQRRDFAQKNGETLSRLYIRRHVNGAMSALRKALKKDIDSLKNQAKYEKLQREAEMEDEYDL